MTFSWTTMPEPAPAESWIEQHERFISDLMDFQVMTIHARSKLVMQAFREFMAWKEKRPSPGQVYQPPWPTE